MRRMSLMAGLAASAGMVAALSAPQRPAHKPARPEDDEKTPRQRKRWLQRQARKKNRINK